MRTLLLLGLLGVFVANGSGGSAAATAAGWGTAAAVPGLATLNSGGEASVKSVSCGGAGACSAGGYYTDASGHTQAFVVNERHGRWEHAREVPGTAKLNTGGDANVWSVSCAGARTCVAGGSFLVDRFHQQAFVVNEEHGRWSRALPVPGLEALNTGGSALVRSMSCPRAGTCAAGGQYYDGSFRPFVVDEWHGSWGDAIEVPGMAALTDSHSAVQSVSCTGPRDCVAFGWYDDGSEDNQQSFMATETNGSWGDAVEVPGTAALNTGNVDLVDSVSCGAPGACAAGGSYWDSPGSPQAFLVSETNGSWGDAFDVPGIVTLNRGGGGTVYSVSCTAGDACAAGGEYWIGSRRRGSNHAFVVSETNGTWGNAIEVPGSATLNTGLRVPVLSVSCAGAGACAAGGYYTNGVRHHRHHQAFVVSETNGIWGNALEVAGTETLNRGGNARVRSVSCTRTGVCAAGGFYEDGSGLQAFVVMGRVVPPSP